MPPQIQNPPSGISFDSKEWLELLARGDHRTLTLKLIAGIEALSKMIVLEHDAATQTQYDNIANLVLFVIAHPAFQVLGDLAERFIRLNHAISSFVSCTHFKTTDAHLEAVRHQQANFVKVLALYSPRNSATFDSARFFELEPALSSVWYSQYAQLAFSSVSSEVIRQRLATHFQNPPTQLVPHKGMQEPYFASTYVDGTCERPIKMRINERIQHATAGVTIRNTPDPRKIAVVTRNWQKNHSVYRICSQWVAALRPHYHLTLVQCGEKRNTDVAAFDSVITLGAGGMPSDVAPLFTNDFQAIIYPDVGMSDESIFLANLRLAPVQAAMPGHPVSTFGSQIDYFITGADVETPDRPEQHYSERLVLLPGMGCIHNRPQWTPTYLPPLFGERAIVNIPAFGQKINAPYLQTLAAIAQNTKRPVHYRLFVGDVIFTFNDYMAFHEQVTAILGAGNFEIVVTLPYDDYMAKLADGHLSLDAWHFGGGNSVSDSLFAGVPMICRVGERWYNRIGAQMLRVAGVPELIATNEPSFISIASRLISDDAWRNELRRKLREARLDETLYSPADARYFRKAMDYLISRDAELRRDPSQNPIRIARD